MQSPSSHDDAGLGGLLRSIAYRMTGSVTEAEDLVQEAYLRLERAQQHGTVVESPSSYLAAATTRLAINHLRSARVRRETYVGTWLPEPIVCDLHERPEQMAELSDSLSMAFLVLLERLSPVERAVLLLRDVFDYSYEDIAQIVDKHEANCRQILARARRHIDAHRARYEASEEHSAALAQSFLAAARGGDLGRLVDLLAADATFVGDGGGKATAVRAPVYGRNRVAALLVAMFDQAPRRGVRVEAVRVNGEAGFIVYDGEDKIVSVFSLEIRGGVIQTVRGIVNPDKLGHLGPVSDIARIRHRREDHAS